MGQDDRFTGYVNIGDAILSKWEKPDRNELDGEEPLTVDEIVVDRDGQELDENATDIAR